MTQTGLAKKTGIPQAHISRIENGNYNPSLAYMKRIAEGLGKELHIEFKQTDQYVYLLFGCVGIFYSVGVLPHALRCAVIKN